MQTTAEYAVSINSNSRIAARKPPGLAIETSDALLRERELQNKEKRERARLRKELRVREHQERGSPAGSAASGSLPSTAASSVATTMEQQQQQHRDGQGHGEEYSNEIQLMTGPSSSSSSNNAQSEYAQSTQQQQYYEQQQQQYNSGPTDTHGHYTDDHAGGPDHPHSHLHPNHQQQHQHGHHHHDNRQYGSDDDEEEEDDDEEDDMDDDHDDSSELELPEAEQDIDYDIVYALHTFLATVEGQASVVKGDQLTLLDDSNSYWWLVRVLKTQLVGYIPAENIETPEERLARFYKKQNLNQARARESDIAHGAVSARRARAHFAQPHHPTNKMLQESQRRPPMQLNPELPGGGRFVDFGPPSFQEYVGYAYSDEETDASMEEGEEGEEGQGDFEDEEEEEGSDGSFEGGSLEDDEHAMARAHGHGYHAHSQQHAYEDDMTMHAQSNSAEYHNDGQDMSQQYYAQSRGGYSAHPDENGKYGPGYDQTRAQELHDASTQPSQQPINRASQAQAQAALGVANGGRPAQYGSASVEPTSTGGQGHHGHLARTGSMNEGSRPGKGMAQFSDENPGQSYTGGAAVTKERTPPGPTSPATSRLKAFTEDATSSSPTASQESVTRKISLTPRIAREDSTDSNLSDASGGGGFKNQSLQPSQQHQNLRAASNASSANADISNVSSISTFSSGPAGRTTPTRTGDADDRSHFRRGSAGSASSSVHSAMSSSSGQKRGASPANDGSSGSSSAKKKKSGGILGSLFSRNRKDKKEDKDKKGEPRKNSESTSDDERTSLTSSPGPESPEREKDVSSSSASGPVAQQLQMRRAQEQAKEDMYGTEAARRQQQVEAQNVMYQTYGIHPRAAGDTTNSSTFAATVTPPTISPGVHGSNSQDGPSRKVSPGQQTQMAISPSQSSMASNLSYGSGLTGRQLRPGSLIGSPHMTNSGAVGEAPVLNVLRVFAGDNIVADATFKTVLLNDGTSTEELVKQAMQRFRLDPPIAQSDTIPLTEAIMAEYYLTAKEFDGEETRLEAGQKPLQIFEKLSQAAGYLKPGQGLPSVKRSSVGSISSISSTLSMNPAIERLRMSDFSDDSNVKLFINKRSTQSARTSKRSSESSSTGTITGRRISDDFQLDANRLSGISNSDKAAPMSASLRFAVKIVIHPSDLPESMAFDPFSQSLIARSALPDREQQASRSPSMSSVNVPSSYREKVLFFPRNANVSEILETALDRFGIVEGVVDGGDEVDSKILKRRSMTRIRYCLAALQPATTSEETLLNPSSKLLEAYARPPAFKPYDRSSKEFRRRSMETPFGAPSAADLLPTDPVFIIRKAGMGISAGFASDLRSRDNSNNSLHMPERSGSRSSGSGSVYATPIAEIPPSLERAMSPQQAKQEIIAAQRAASRANQRAMLSAHKNENHGVDVVLADRSLIRSSRDGASMRYSYIAADGASEVDISEIVENEWRSDSRQSHGSSGHGVVPRDSPSAMSHLTAESYTSALASPLTPAANLPGYYNARGSASENAHDAEEQMDIERVARAPLNYDEPHDYLEQALAPGRTANTVAGTPSSGTTDNIDQRLERVLSKVRKGAAASGPAGVASALRSQQQNASYQTSDAGHQDSRQGSTAESGRSTPAQVARMGSAASERGPSYVSQMMRARSSSATSYGSNGRSSPGPQILDKLASSSARSTPQPEAPPSSGSSTPRRAPSKGHIKQPSLASIASDSSSVRSRSPSTPVTMSAGNTTSTPVSSTRNDSSTSHRLAIPYRDDLGLDFLMQLVELESGRVQRSKPTPYSVMAVLTGQYDFPQLTPEMAAVYDKPRRKLDDLDSVMSTT